MIRNLKLLQAFTNFFRKKQPDRKSIFSIFGRNRGSSKDLDETVDSKRSSVELVHTHNIVSGGLAKYSCCNYYLYYKMYWIQKIFNPN